MTDYTQEDWDAETLSDKLMITARTSAAPKADCELMDQAAREIERLSKAVSGAGLAPDVVRLVIAARVAAFEDHIADHEARRELDAASEAFADRVPWENEPGDLRGEVRAFLDSPQSQ